MYNEQTIVNIWPALMNFGASERGECIIFENLYPLAGERFFMPHILPQVAHLCKLSSRERSRILHFYCNSIARAKFNMTRDVLCEIAACIYELLTTALTRG